MVNLLDVKKLLLIIYCGIKKSQLLITYANNNIVIGI